MRKRSRRRSMMFSLKVLVVVVFVSGTALESGLCETSEGNSSAPPAAPLGVGDPEMVSIPATTFWMGDPWGEGLANEQPFHQVELSAYQIGKYNVTNAQFAEFLNSMLAEGRIEYASRIPEGGFYSVQGWWKPGTRFILFQDYPDTPFSQIEHLPDSNSFSVRTRDGYSMADHPVVCESWWGAASYCNWLSRKQGLQECYGESGSWPCDFTKNGYHLPTEAQWECAAAWDPTWDDPTARSHWRYSYRDNEFSFSRTNSTIHVYVAPNIVEIEMNNPLGLRKMPCTTPVGFFNGINIGRNGPTHDSPSYYGCYDMTGNTWDWCNDWRQDDYYSYSPENDPTGPDGGSVRALRGASWYCYPFHSRTSYRWAWEPWVTYPYAGFRVARQELSASIGPAVVTIHDRDVTITWQTVPGKRCQLQVCDDIARGDWADLGGPVASEGALVERVDSGSASLRSRFYRILCLP